MLDFIKQNRVPAFIISGSLVLNAVLWLLVLLLFPRDSGTAVLHYNTDVGIDFIGPSVQIIVLPAVGLLLLLGNSLLGTALRRADKRAAFLLWGSLPVLQLILLGSFILVWQANT